MIGPATVVARRAMAGYGGCRKLFPASGGSMIPVSTDDLVTACSEALKGKRKVVIITRGAPGCGKTTLAGMVQGDDRNRFSTDDFFARDGVYKPDASKLGEAHAWCFGRYLRAICQDFNEGLYVVHNTGGATWEVQPYYLAAESQGFDVIVVRFDVPVVSCIARQRHAVPVNHLRVIHETVEDRRNELPHWRGIVMDDRASLDFVTALRALGYWTT